MEKNYRIRPCFNRRNTATMEKSAKVEIEIFFSRTERKWIPTEIELYANQWDGEFVVRHTEYKKLNKKVTDLMKSYEGIIINLRRNGKDVNLANFNSELNKIKSETKASFIEFAFDAAQKRGLRDSTLRAHITTIEALKRSRCVETFEDLTSENIRKFDIFLREEDTTREQTTLHNYHKRLKPYINEAIRLGYLEESPYSKFRDIKGKYKEREPLTDYELKQLRELKLENRSFREARDLFIFSAYTGLCYADMNLFDYKKDVVLHENKAYIDGERLKTGTKFYTPILPPAMEVLKKYDFKLPVPSVQSYNRMLRCVGELINLKKPLTSHIARHTFATTVILANDVPIEALSKMLGHTKISITQVYAKVLNSSVERHTDKLISKIY